jgi:hypothetical protein
MDRTNTIACHILFSLRIIMKLKISTLLANINCRADVGRKSLRLEAAQGGILPMFCVNRPVAFSAITIACIWTYAWKQEIRNNKSAVLITNRNHSRLTRLRPTKNRQSTGLRADEESADTLPTSMEGRGERERGSLAKLEIPKREKVAVWRCLL